jgi:hypothetical protein
VQADTIVPEPGNPQALNRYSYVYNNPLRYVDPSGYLTEEQIMAYFGVETWEEVLALFEEGRQLQGRWGWLDVLRAAEVEDEVRFLNATGQEVFSGRFFVRENQLFIGRDDVSLPQLEAAQRGDIYELTHYIEHPEEPNLGEALAGGFVIVVSDLFIGIPGAYLTIVGGGLTPVAHAGEILDLIALGGNIFGLYLIVDSGVVPQLAPTVRSVEYVEVVPAFLTESDSRLLAPRVGPAEGSSSPRRR